MAEHAIGDRAGPMLEIGNVSKGFFLQTVNQKIALRDICLSLATGDFVTGIGSNGAGKSTLLNVVAGRYRPELGTVRIAGRDVTKLPDHRVSRYVGRVFQDPMAGTAPHLTIEENLAIAWTRVHGRGLRLGVSRRRRQIFRDELRTLELGLEDRLGARVGLLSGGQRQALSLVMASFTQPQILLLDEHTAALDPQRAALITRLTAELVARQRLTTLMVTHNMAQALALGNRLIMMHEGRIILELAGRQKQEATVADLLGRFDQIKSAQLADRSMLG